MIQKFNKVVLGFLIFALLVTSTTFVSPKEAQALFDGCWVFCPVQLGNDILSSGANLISAPADVITGGSTTIDAGVNTSKLIVDGTPIERAITDAVLSPTVCDQFANANLLLDTLDSVGNSLAGSDKAKMSNTFFISYKVESTRSQLRDCWMPLELVAQVAKGGTNSQAQNLEQNRNLIAQKKQTLTLQLTDYEKQKKQSFQDIFEAIGYNFAMEAFKQVTVKGVNELVDKLKINGYLEYADALATQVYSIDYIKKNYSGDQQRELIAASLFKSQAFNDIPGLNNAVSMVKQKAKEYKVDAASLDWSNPKYWNQVSNSADERVWPQYHMFVGLNDAQQAKTAGLKSANDEVQNGKGIKSMRKCKDVTGVQAKIDSDLTAANKKVEEAEIAVALLEMAESNAYEIDAAKKEYEKALAEAKAVQGKSNGGLAKSCEAITKPANFLAETTSEWLSSFIKQNTDINTANISLFGTLAGKLANTVFKDLINGKGGSVLTELKKGIVPIGVSAGLQAVINSSGSNPTGNESEGDSGLVVGNGASMRVSFTSGANRAIVLKVKFETNDRVLPKKLQIEIVEVGDPSKVVRKSFDILPSDFDTANGLVTGQIEFDDVRPTKKSNYTVKFIGIDRDAGVELREFAKASVIVGAGTVAGAYTSAPYTPTFSNTFMPRGPENKY